MSAFCDHCGYAETANHFVVPVCVQHIRICVCVRWCEPIVSCTGICDCGWVCVCLWCVHVCDCLQLSVSPGFTLIDHYWVLWRWKGCCELILRYESWVSSVWCEHILITEWKETFMSYPSSLSISLRSVYSPCPCPNFPSSSSPFVLFPLLVSHSLTFTCLWLSLWLPSSLLTFRVHMFSVAFISFPLSLCSFGSRSSLDICLWVFYFSLFALKKVTSFLTHPSFSSLFPFVLKERMFPSFLLSFLMSLPLSCLRSFLLISRLIFYFFTTILHSSPRLWTLNDQSVHSCHDSSISTALSLSFYSSLSHSHTLVKFCMDFSKGVHEVSFHLNVSCFKSPFKDSMTINVEFDFDHVWPHTPGLYGQSLDEKVEKRRKEDFLVINGHRVAAFVPFSLDPCVPSVVQRGWSYNRRHMWWRKTTRSLNSHRCDCSFSTF